jgi:hypothetical protein
MEVTFMTGKRIWKLIFALIIIAGLAVGGIALYQMGFTHGAMTNLTLPESGQYPLVPFGHLPLGWHSGPRMGLLGFFPLLCFGGFFFLVLMFGFGFMARKRAWMHHYGPGFHPGHWKQSGPPPWGPGRPPWTQDQPETESEIPSPETDSSEG